jgi:hypothetical protein
LAIRFAPSLIKFAGDELSLGKVLTILMGFIGPVNRVLQELFGRSVLEARRNLQRHVSKWSAKGRCPELPGGRLIRSAVSRAVQRVGGNPGAA